MCRPTASNPCRFTLGTPPTIAGSFGTFFKPISAGAVYAKVGRIGEVVAAGPAETEVANQ